MQLTYNGKTSDLELLDMTIGQAREMAKLGINTMQEFEQSLAKAEFPALQMAYWLWVSQRGETIALEDVDFQPVRFAMAIINAARAVDDSPKEV